MTRAEVLRYIAVLTAEFRKRGMAVHAKRAEKWPADFIVEWMKTLQLPPFESAYQVRPRNQGCPQCPPTESSTFTECVFEGGSRHHCSKCGITWLELDGK
jgi:hypothetical protein